MVATDVYILDVAAFLPNKPVTNDQITAVLGEGPSSRMRKLVLRNNGIQTRYYAVDPATGKLTHSNAQLAAAAVRGLREYPAFTLADIQTLACGTSSPDQALPGHASMVHAELGSPACEVVSTSGVCVAGMTAMKYAYAAVKAGLCTRAVATGSELSSSYMRSEFCCTDSSSPALDAEFLRWMLSDGAGAALLAPDRPLDRPALRIDWIEMSSFAHELEACMYAGAVKGEDGKLTGWRTFPVTEAATNGALLVKQDMKLLNREVVLTSVDRALPPIIAKHGLKAESIDWFLPHYSSHYFRQPIADRLTAIGFAIPFEHWFTNLSDKGNTGSASIYIILAELLHSGRLRKGQRILCFIPESGRFTICYMLLTVV